MMMISYKIACASGVLVQGGSPDFLVCIATAREKKQEWSRHLPHSTLRVQFFYPNNKRVPSSDIKAALRSLADPSVAAAVAVRHANYLVDMANFSQKNGEIGAGASEARRAGFAGVLGGLVGRVFSQAGVVAPPDSPDLGNLPVSFAANFVA